MKRKWILQVITAFMICVTLAGCAASGSNTFVDEKSSNTELKENKNHILVAYFSWSGNTKDMAEQIVEQTGGDLFEIVPKTKYPDSYEETGNIAKEERDRDLRPDLASYPDIQDYDTILIGYPIWWHTAPMVIGTFLEHYDLKNVDIYPFSQSASMDKEQFSQSLDYIKECAKNANVHDGLFVSSTDTNGISAYLEKNNLK